MIRHNIMLADGLGKASPLKHPLYFKIRIDYGEKTDT